MFSSSCSTLPALRQRPLAVAALLACTLASTAQAQAADASLAPVTITGSTTSPALTGFGDTPAARSPLQTTVISAAQLQDSGTSSLSGLTRADASVGDAYNAAGYWSILKIRGYTLDNRFNYRRDGLPINAETTLGLDNKDRVEILKGTSGIQSGISSPGGLVNMVVKRPTTSVRSVSLGWEERGTVGATMDVSERFGADDRFGLRVNAAWKELDPKMEAARGRYQLLAAAGDWRLSPDSLLEAEVEYSHRSQPSAPGFSLLGNRVPDAGSIDPNTNLNKQSWALPVVTDGTTASLRWQQQLAAGWKLQAHGLTQQLRSDDRIAFPYGCSAENVWDRYCSDGSYDLYDFRSEHERRRTDALDVSVSGRAQTGALQHQISTGALFTRSTARFQRQAYNWVGVGSLDGQAITPAAPELTDENTNRSERSSELYLRDAIELSPSWSLWAGLRHTHLHRESIRTDGSRPIDYSQDITTPWLALKHQITAQTMVYASWGQGIETEVVANRSRYTNAGQALPALRSHQTELGLKHAQDSHQWSLTAFDVHRPRAADTGACDVAGSCTRIIDGQQHHLGLEAAGSLSAGPWSLGGSALVLRARIQGSQNSALDDARPDDVPTRVLKLNSSYRVAQLPGLQLQASVQHESSRVVLPYDNSITIPAWTTLDLGTRWSLRTSAGVLTWRVGVDNVTDHRAWRESPYQFDHAYLFPLAPRTWRTQLQLDL